MKLTSQSELVVSVIPAQPGWFVAVIVDDPDDPLEVTDHDPVIAWRIETRTGPYGCASSVHAITVDPSSGTSVLLRPDGLYVIPDDSVAAEYRSQAALLARWAKIPPETLK